MKVCLLILIILCISTIASGKDEFDERLKNLVLRAKVLEMKLDRTDAKYPRCELKLEVTFTNEGNEPIIILQKHEDFNGFSDFIFSNGVSVYGKFQDGHYIIENSGGLPSVCTGCNENLGKILDEKTPPDKYTKILKPNESFTLIEESGFGLLLKTKSGSYGWDEVENNNWKVFGSVTYSMFPINLGKYGENFGHIITKTLEKIWCFVCRQHFTV